MKTLLITSTKEEETIYKIAYPTLKFNNKNKPDERGKRPSTKVPSCTLAIPAFTSKNPFFTKRR